MKCLSIFLCFIALLGCQPSQKDDHTLIIGTNAQYYPFEFKQAGELKGFDVELAHLMGEALGKNIQLVDMDFDALIISLQQEKVDMIMAGISITPQREKAIEMIPYQGMGASELYLVFETHQPLTKALNDPSLKVAAEASSFQAKFIDTHYPKTSLKTLNNYADMLLELKSGKIDAIFMEPHVYQGMKAKDPMLTFVAVPVPEGQRGKGNGIGIKKKNLLLAEQITEVLEQLRDTGQLQALEAKWFVESQDV